MTIKDVLEECKKPMNSSCPHCGEEFLQDEIDLDQADLAIKKIVGENKAIELLTKADEVLGSYWFTAGEDTEDYNNDDVIELNREISEYLADLKKRLEEV